MASANTNPIGGGTCNLSTNLLVEERSILGKLAFRKGISTGQLVRRLIGQGLAIEDPDLAKSYKAARLSRYSRYLGLFALGTMIIWQSMFVELSPRRGNWFRQPVTVVRRKEA